MTLRPRGAAPCTAAPTRTRGNPVAELPSSTASASDRILNFITETLTALYVLAISSFPEPHIPARTHGCDEESCCSP